LNIAALLPVLGRGKRRSVRKLPFYYAGLAGFHAIVENAKIIMQPDLSPSAPSD
jgi:hypothetical protein